VSDAGNVASTTEYEREFTGAVTDLNFNRGNPRSRFHGHAANLSTDFHSRAKRHVDE